MKALMPYVLGEELSDSFEPTQQQTVRAPSDVSVLRLSALYVKPNVCCGKCLFMLCCSCAHVT
jgi:hypothetical protein